MDIHDLDGNSAVNRYNGRDRACQFAPFAALGGLGAALCDKEKAVEKRVDLPAERAEELDHKLHRLGIGEKVLIEYYDRYRYIKTYGTVKKIDEVTGKLRLDDTDIYFENILDLPEISAY